MPMQMSVEVKNTSFYVNIINFKIISSWRELLVERRCWCDKGFPTLHARQLIISSMTSEQDTRFLCNIQSLYLQIAVHTDLGYLLITSYKIPFFSLLKLMNIVLCVGSRLSWCWCAGCVRPRIQNGIPLLLHILRSMADAPRYVSNSTLHNDLGIPFIKDVLQERSTKDHDRLDVHPNALLQPLMEK